MDIEIPTEFKDVDVDVDVNAQEIAQDTITEIDQGQTPNFIQNLENSTTIGIRVKF